MRLEVVDQHGQPFLSKPLTDYPNEGTERLEIRIEEHFAVQDQLIIRIVSDELETDFEVNAQYA